MDAGGGHNRYTGTGKGGCRATNESSCYIPAGCRLMLTNCSWIRGTIHLPDAAVFSSNQKT